MESKARTPLTEAREYWMNQLSGDFEEAFILSDLPRTRKYEEKSRLVSIKGEQYLSLVEICKGSEPSIFVFLLTALEVLLHKYTGSSEIFVGIPPLKAQGRALNNIFITRNKIEAENTYKSLLLRVKDSVLQSYKHSVYPIGKIIKMQALGKFAKLFRYVAFMRSIHAFENQADIGSNEFENDFILSINKAEGEIELKLSYNAYLFKDSTIKQLLERYMLVISQALCSIEKPVRDIELDGLEKDCAPQCAANRAREARVAASAAQVSIINRIYKTINPSHMRIETDAETGRLTGIPEEGSGIYIVDENKKPKAVGFWGELAVGGLKTTGEYGRRVTDGRIELLGRDRNKILNNMELYDAELQLKQYKGIKDVLLLPAEDNRGFYAYFTAEGALDGAGLKEHCNVVMPPYMMPKSFRQLAELPLDAAGNIDFASLAEICSGEGYIPPRNKLEVELIDIWAEILELSSEKIGIASDFFELGGHSLKITTLLLRLERLYNTKMQVSEFLKNSTVSLLSEYISKKDKCVMERIPSAPETKVYPLSATQKRLYFLQKMNPESTSYNMVESLLLEGNIDIEKIESTFKKLVQRHESLRTCFVSYEGEIYQQISGETGLEIEVFDLEEGRIEEGLQKCVCPFELEKVPLIRVSLGRLGGDKGILLIELHHIISDGISNNILIEDFIALYKEQNIEMPGRTYKDYSVWQQQRQGEIVNKQRAYWLKEFKEELIPLNIFTDFPRPAVQSFRGSSISFEMPEAVLGSLKKIAAERNTTVFVVLMTCWYILVHKLSNQRDVVIGTVTSGRTHQDLQGIVGSFINTLPIRLSLESGQAFYEVLEVLRDKMAEALDNQDYKFEELIDELNLERSIDRNPLFDTMIVMQNVQRISLDIEGLRLEKYDIDRKSSKFDLTLFCHEQDRRLAFELEYCTDLFEKGTVERYGEYFRSIIFAVINDVNLSLEAVELITPEERHLYVEEFNNTDYEYSYDSTVQELFDACAEAQPESIALLYKGKAITYRELKQRSDQLAAALRGLGVEKGDILGISMDNSPELVVGILGALKAGGAYVPIDPEFPEARKSFILEDCRCRLLLSLSTVDNKYSAGRCEVVNTDNPGIYVGAAEGVSVVYSPEDIIYIIYTSGSTGTPKGCMLKQKNVVNYAEWAIRQYFGEEKVYFPLYSSIAYDLTVTSIFAPLLGGQTVVIYPRTLDVLKTIVNDGISNIIKLTPTHLRLLLDIDCRRSALKKLIVGGEQLTAVLAQKTMEKLGKGIDIYNEYGPTETTVGCMIHRFDPLNNKRNAVPIGVPAQNTKIYILDENMRLCPPGVVGELYISGEGVAPGYINCPEITEKCFLPDIFEARSEKRMYKTGDLALYLSGGIIEYAGRRDSQIKIRGHRIEIGEIQKHILDYPGIKEAVVLVKEGQQQYKFLLAYYVSECETDGAQLKNYLSGMLPDYMVPASFIRLEAIPVDMSGKINLKVLPDLKLTERKMHEIPKNEVEQYLFEIWSGNLGISDFSINDNFFEIGGNSFLLMKLHSQISDAYPEVKITDFFKYTTIKAFADFLTAAEPKRQLNIMNMLITLPGEYFEGRSSSGDRSGTFIKLQGEDLDKLVCLAEQSGVNMNDILITVFAFVLSNISGRERININTCIDNSDKVLPLTVDMSISDELQQLFQYVNKNLTKADHGLYYKPEELKDSNIKNMPNTTMVLVANRSFPDTWGAAARLYDIRLIMGEMNNEELIISFDYDRQAFDNEKMDMIFELFAGLLGNL